MKASTDSHIQRSVSTNTLKFLSELCYSLHSAAPRFIPFEVKAKVLLIFKTTTQAFESEPGKSHYACATLLWSGSDSSEQRERLWGEWAGLSERHETVSMKRLWSGRGLPLRRGGTTGEQTDKTFCFYSILVFRHDCHFVDEAIKSILFYNLIYD